MHPFIEIFIQGVPYCRSKNRGKKSGPDDWTQAIKTQTAHLQKIETPCHLSVVFYLPPDKYPKDFPHGPDLDNLLKRLQDALNHTILSDLPNGDSAIIKLEATKIKVPLKKAGAKIMIFKSA